jgi:hypothetical protein
VRRKWRLNRVEYLITCTISSSRRDAEIAYVISLVVRRHGLSAEETEKFLLELHIPRAANVAQITDGLVVNSSQKASSELAAQS